MSVVEQVNGVKSAKVKRIRIAHIQSKLRIHGSSDASLKG